jgi:hypothetical protein
MTSDYIALRVASVNSRPRWLLSTRTTNGGQRSARLTRSHRRQRRNLNRQSTADRHFAQ